MTCPEDLATGRLEVEHVVEGLLDDRPQRLEEAPVAGEEPVVPGAGGDVGDHVGVELGVLDAAVDVVGVPGAGVLLVVGQPPVGGLGLVEVARDGQGHRCLDMVPRVGMAAGEPGDHPVGELDFGDRVGGAPQVFDRE